MQVGDENAYGKNGKAWRENANARRKERKHLRGAAGICTNREQKLRTKRKRAIDI